MKYIVNNGITPLTVLVHRVNNLLNTTSMEDCDLIALVLHNYTNEECYSQKGLLGGDKSLLK